MKVRSVVLALALALLVGVTACSKKKSETPQGMGENNLQAQHPRMTSQERIDQLAQQLTLTEEQKTKLLDLFTQEETAFQKPSADDIGDREAMRAEIEKRREEMNEKIKGILTAEQFAQYEKLRSERPRGQHPRMTPQERTDRLAEQLTLTADQKTKVLDLFTLEETSFQKPSTGDTSDREAMRTAMEKRREELNTKLKAILTKEQFAQYEKLRSERPRGMGEHTPPAQP